MSLRRRLDALRRQAGGAAPEGELRQRLERLRPQRRGPVPQAGAPDPEALARRVGGELLEQGLVRIESRLAPGSRHGRVTLDGLAPLDWPGLALSSREGLGFLDTETSGLAGGTGTVAYVVGLAVFRGGVLHLRQYLLGSFQAERALLARLECDLAGLAALVTYNGGSFDLPLLRDRFGLARRPSPVHDLVHLDLLHAVRALFRRRLPDCRLASCEGHLLGFARHGDLPGSEAPEVWFDWVRRGNCARMPEVLRHNRLDIISLAALLERLEQAWADPAAAGADPLGAARAWERGGNPERAFCLLQAQQHALDARGWLELARRCRQRGEWAAARGIWEQRAHEGCAESAESLAKYHEHVARDPQAALAAAAGLPEGEASRRRRERLKRKAARPASGRLGLG